jgi:hypothetical protein
MLSNTSNTFYSINFDYEKQPLMDAYISANTNSSYIVPAGANSSALFSPFFEHFPPCVIPKDDRSIKIQKIVHTEYRTLIGECNGMIIFPVNGEALLCIYSYDIQADPNTGRPTINSKNFTPEDMENIESTIVTTTPITQPMVVSGFQLFSIKRGSDLPGSAPTVLSLMINGTESWSNVCNVVIANSNTINWVESHEIIFLDEEVPQ